MAKYVNLDALGIGKCNPDVFVNKGYAQGWNSAIEILENAIAADVAPVVRGRWVDGRCDNCGEHAPYWCLSTTYHKSSYCPNCGADMREVQDDA